MPTLANSMNFNPTQYGVVIGGTSSEPLNQVSGLGTSGQFFQSQGSGSAPIWATAPAGSAVGYSQTTSTTATSTSTNIGVTGTTPTTSNTVSLISATYTASSTSNYLIFEFSAPFSVGSPGCIIGFFLFSGTTLLCSFPYGSSPGQPYTAYFRYSMLAASTSSTTYHIYWAGSTGTSYLLSNSGSVFYNSSSGTQICFSVLEIVP